jgi:outer membrane immunogenic protein
MMIKALSIGVVLGGLAVLPAMAADLAVYKAPAPAVFSWTGCYVGATAGGTQATSSDTWSPNPAFFGSDASTMTSQTAASVKASGFTGGGELGCNYQWSPWLVVGIEGDIQATDLSWGHSGAASLPAPLGQFPFNETFTSHWFSTIRARAGYAAGNWLFFGTAGVAFADFGATDTMSMPFFGTVNTGSGNTTGTGWTAGGGIEWAFARQWTIKAEYLYVDVSGLTYASANSAAAFGFANSTIVHTHGDLKENVGRIGINYKFW